MILGADSRTLKVYGFGGFTQTYFRGRHQLRPELRGSGEWGVGVC